MRLLLLLLDIKVLQLSILQYNWTSSLDQWWSTTILTVEISCALDYCALSTRNDTYMLLIMTSYTGRQLS